MPVRDDDGAVWLPQDAVAVAPAVRVIAAEHQSAARVELLDQAGELAVHVRAFPARAVRGVVHRGAVQHALHERARQAVAADGEIMIIGTSRDPRRVPTRRTLAVAFAVPPAPSPGLVLVGGETQGASPVARAAHEAALVPHPLVVQAHPPAAVWPALGVALALVHARVRGVVPVARAAWAKAIANIATPKCLRL